MPCSMSGKFLHDPVAFLPMHLRREDQVLLMLSVSGDLDNRELGAQVTSDRNAV